MIIGFGHQAQVGKDESCNYLAREFNFKKDAFAYSLKEGIGKVVFGLTDEQVSINKETIDPFWGMTPRRILQLAGTEGGRNIFGKDLWIKTLERRIKNDPYANIAICDVRYLNEAEAIKSWGGIVVKIERDIIGTTSEHISETELLNWEGWDYYIDNNKTFDYLYKQLDMIIMKELHGSNDEERF